MKRLALWAGTAAVLAGCGSIPQPFAADPVARASDYGPGYRSSYEFGGVPAESLYLCAQRGAEPRRRVYTTLRDGIVLDRILGGTVFRRDRDYVVVPIGDVAALVAIPAGAQPLREPVVGRDQQDVAWILGPASTCPDDDRF